MIQHATFPQNNQTTDGSGNATFTMTTTTPGTDEINLYDSNGPTTFSDWFTVTFYDASKGCSNVPAAPVLSSVVSNSNNSATLTWTDSADPVSNYLVSYGIASKSYIYGDPNVGGQGTTSFTIGALAGNKKYYFAVGASNNCGASGLSNEVSVIVNPIPATPAPTVAPTPTDSGQADTPIPTAMALTDLPTPTDSGQAATPTPAPQDVNSTFRDLGIGVIAAGVVLVGSVLSFQIIRKKNRIPPMRSNPPQIPLNTPSSQPPPINNIPQQPY